MVAKILIPNQNQGVSRLFGCSTDKNIIKTSNKPTMIDNKTLKNNKKKALLINIDK